MDSREGVTLLRLPPTDRERLADLDLVDEGVGVPVLCSHGGHSDRRYWEPQQEAFAARYRFVTYTRPSPRSQEQHAADLAAVIRFLEAGPAHIVGFSTAIALRAALQEPALVRSLVVIEPNVPWLLEGDPEGERVLTWWRAENERVRTEAAGDPERAAALWFELVDNRGPGTFAAQPEPLRRMWLDNFGATQTPAPPIEPLTCERLGAITAPTLALGAEHGMPYSRRIVERLAACIPGCRLVIVPGVTHFMSYQAPDVFNDVVLDFLADH